MQDKNGWLTINLAVAVLAAGAAACSTGASQDPATAASEAVAEAETALSLPAAWDEESMTLDQQVAFMKTRVVPAMGVVFAEHEQGEFGCQVCHGPDNKEPDEFLPSLLMKDGHITAFQEEPEVSQFMAEKVVPAMAKAMGLEPYNVETGQGFGCAGCHRLEQE